jgi:multiple sugar transport system permease protein
MATASTAWPTRLATVRLPRRSLDKAPRFLLAAALATLWAIPVVWMLRTAFMPEVQIITVPPRLMPDNVTDFTLANFMNVLLIPRGVDLPRSFMNSLVVSLVGTSLVLIVDVLAAYAFARLRFPGRDVLFFAVIASLIVPHEILLIPHYIIVWQLDFLNSLNALILPPVASAFGVFLLRQFFLSIPGELEDAARIDGCGRFRNLLAIVLPLSGGAVATLAIFTFLYYWNDFTWPYIVINSADQMTLPVALIQFRGDYWSEFGKLMAGATIATVPAIVIFLTFQRLIIRSITLTGLKG